MGKEDLCQFDPSPTLPKKNEEKNEVEQRRI